MEHPSASAISEVELRQQLLRSRPIANPASSFAAHPPASGRFILVQEGELHEAGRRLVGGEGGDLLRMPRGIPHGYFNKSTSLPVRCSGSRPPGGWKTCSAPCTT